MFFKGGGLPPQTRYSHDLSIEDLCRSPGARAQAPEMVYTIVCTLFDTKHSQSHKHHGPLCMFSLMGLACTVIVMCLVFSVSFLPFLCSPCFIFCSSVSCSFSFCFFCFNVWFVLFVVLAVILFSILISMPQPHAW